MTDPSGAMSRPPGPSLLARATFPVFMPLAALGDEPFHLSGGFSDYSPNVNVTVHHNLGDRRLVRVHSTNGYHPGDHRHHDDPFRQRAAVALALHFETGGTLPVVIESWTGRIRVATELVSFEGAQCATAWVADAVVMGTNVRVEAAGIEPEYVQLIEIPQAMRRQDHGF